MSGLNIQYVGAAEAISYLVLLRVAHKKYHLSEFGRGNMKASGLYRMLI